MCAMAGMTAAPTIRCITISPAAAEVVVAAASGSASDAASAASAMLAHRRRGCAVRRSSRVSSSQPSSDAATVTPMTWPTVIVWRWPALKRKFRWMPSRGTSTTQARAAASAPPAAHSARVRPCLVSGAAGAAVVVSMAHSLMRLAAPGCAADHEALPGCGNRASSGWRPVRYRTGSSGYSQRSSSPACAETMALTRRRYTLRVMGIKRVVRLPRRWLDALGVALVAVLAVVGAYVEANPAHRYGGLHLTSHPPLAAYLLLAVPAVALIWRNSRPVEVLGLAVAGAAGWAALGQIDGAALVPVIVGVYWVALTRPWRIAVAAGLAGAVAIFVTEGLLGPFGWFGGPNATMWPELLAAGVVGGYVAARRQWLAAEHDRGVRAEQAREEETRRRVAAERMRIARELHDVVAHHRPHQRAGHRRKHQPAAIRRARPSIQAIRNATRPGCTSCEPRSGCCARSTPDALRCRSRTRALAAISSSRAAAADHGGARRAARAAARPVALAAYRIVQEALTNVISHAGRTPRPWAYGKTADHVYVAEDKEGGAEPAAPVPGPRRGWAAMRSPRPLRAAPWMPGRRAAAPVRARLPKPAAAPAAASSRLLCRAAGRRGRP